MKESKAYTFIQFYFYIHKMRLHSSNSGSKKIEEHPFAFITVIFNKQRLQSSFYVYSRLTRVRKASWKTRFALLN